MGWELFWWLLTEFCVLNMENIWARTSVLVSDLHFDNIRNLHDHFAWLFVCLHWFQHFFGHILAVGTLNMFLKHIYCTLIWSKFWQLIYFTLKSILLEATSISDIYKETWLWSMWGSKPWSLCWKADTLTTRSPLDGHFITLAIIVWCGGKTSSTGSVFQERWLANWLST